MSGPSRTSGSSGSGGSASPLGVYLPDNWGVNWKPKRNAAASGPARIALLGDSIGKGYFSSNLDTKGWFALVAAALRSQYGDGGSGFKGIVDSIPWMTANGSLTAGIRTAYNTAGCLIGATGFATVASGGATGAGPCGAGLKAGSAADTLTWSGSTALRGTTLKLFFLNSGAPFTIAVDGGAPANGNVSVSGGGSYNAGVVTPGGGTSVGTVTVTAAAGSHSLLVTATGWVTGGGAGDITIYGAAGENATGIIANNFSRYGAFGSDYVNVDTLVTGSWNGGFNYPADLVLFAMGLNDAHSGGTAADTVIANMQSYFAGVLDTKNGSGSFAGSTAAGTTDIMLVVPHIGGYDSSKIWAGYQARFRGFAQGYGAAMIDFSAVGRRSWNYWNTLGYWSNPLVPGSQGTDPVHPDDAGHSFIASVVQPYL